MKAEGNINKAFARRLEGDPIPVEIQKPTVAERLDQVLERLELGASRIDQVRARVHGEEKDNEDAGMLRTLRADARPARPLMGSLEGLEALALRLETLAQALEGIA